MKKPYILNLKFGITQWRVWFMAEDDEETQKSWREAKKALEEVGDSCSEPQEFYRKTIAHFKEYGFVHVQG